MTDPKGLIFLSNPHRNDFFFCSSLNTTFSYFKRGFKGLMIILTIYIPMLLRKRKGYCYPLHLSVCTSVNPSVSFWYGSYSRELGVQQQFFSSEDQIS